MSISKIEAAMVALIDDCTPDGVSVASGPAEWSGLYTQRLLGELPAIRVVFLGGEVENSTYVSLDANFIVYVVVGWRGQDDDARRHGAGMAYELLHNVIPLLHSCDLEDEQGNRLSRLTVENVETLTDAPSDTMSLAVYAVTVVAQIPMDPDPVALKQRLDDFLTMGHDLDLPGEGEAVDLPGITSIPQ